MTGAVFVPPVGREDLAALAVVAPLAADLFLAVGPFVVPATALASRAFVESADSETGAATREFLREDPWAGMARCARAGGSCWPATTTPL